MSPVSYAYAHTKVRRARGKATEHKCADCGLQASQWAYRGGSEFEQSGYRVDDRAKAQQRERLYTWSPDVYAYDPLCVPCHLLRDKKEEPHV